MRIIKCVSATAQLSADNSIRSIVGAVSVKPDDMKYIRGIMLVVIEYGNVAMAFRAVQSRFSEENGLSYVHYVCTGVPLGNLFDEEDMNFIYTTHASLFVDEEKE